MGGAAGYLLLAVTIQIARLYSSRDSALHHFDCRLSSDATRRDVEFGLGFYRDEKISRYERGEIPGAEHLLVARDDEHGQLKKLLAGRYFISFGAPTLVNPQHLEIFWVSSSGAARE